MRGGGRIPLIVKAYLDAAAFAERFGEIPCPGRKLAVGTGIAQRQADHGHTRAVFGDALHSSLQHGSGIAFSDDFGGTGQDFTGIADGDAGTGFSEIKRNNFDMGSLLQSVK